MPDRRYTRPATDAERTMIRALSTVPLLHLGGPWRFRDELVRSLKAEPETPLVVTREQAERLRALVLGSKGLPEDVKRMARTPVGSFTPADRPPDVVW